MFAALLLLVQDDLVEQLGSRRVEEREAAMRRLREMGESVRPLLMRAARDTDPEIRDRVRFLLRALEIAERLTPALRRTFPDLEDRLVEGDDRAWCDTLRRLAGANLAPADAEVLVRGVLECSEGREERLAACSAVSGLRLLALAPELTEYLRDSDEFVRGAAAETLVLLEARTAIPDLAELLRTGDRGTAQAAASVLGELSGPRAAAELLDALFEPRAEAREAALVGIRLAGPDACLPGMMRLFRSGRPAEQKAASSALIALGWGRAVRELEALRKGADEDLRRLIDHTTQGIAETSSMLALWVMAGEPNPVLRAGAARGLAESGGRKELDRLHTLARDASALVRRAAAQGIGQVGEPKSAHRLRALLRDESELVREAAANAAGRLASPEPELELRSLLRDRSVPVRAAAAGALGEIRALKSESDLCRLAKDPDPDVRKSVARSLGRIGKPESAKTLKVLLEDREPRVQLEAADALCRLGRKEGLRLVAESAEDLTAINALRTPDEWKALQETVKADRTGLLLESLQQAGLRPEPEEYFRRPPDRTEPLLSAVLRAIPGDRALLLEKDRVRVVPKAVAKTALLDWAKRQR